MGAHILKNYDDSLRSLKEDVIAMGALALTALGKSLSGLTKGDRALCEEVIDEDRIINSYEKNIDELGMSILLRFNPVASDLRHVLSSLNICRNLGRIGDHAVDIAKRVCEINRAVALDEVRLIEPLQAKVSQAVLKVITAYADLDEVVARRVIKKDHKIDDHYKALHKTLLQHITNQPETGESILNLVFIADRLQRIAELAVNIAEDLIFSTSAQDIRHSSEI